MAKGKTANPADAFRKAQRKKELKKASNKAERSKTRDFALVKKDTRDLEDEIEKLAADATGNKSRLEELKTELDKINKKKEEYVAEHPEHRKLVYRQRRDFKETEKEVDAPQPQTRNLFKKNGLPRHPERSIYYDPVLNPYGVPPPGLPYVERSLRPDEVTSDQEKEDDADDDIAMPEGPPPGSEHVDSDDDIPMPEGPPPGQETAQTLPPLPALSMPYPGSYPPLPSAMPMPPPPVPVGLSPLGAPPPPFGFGIPPPPPPSHRMPFTGAFPPPLPPGFVQYGLPPPPPGFFPRRSQSSGSIQDPLSSVPHQTFQAHKADKTFPTHPSLPPKPVAYTGAAPTSTTVSAAAVVSAEPELRDFKKEATAFVPAALKRKRGGGAASSSKVNAAPSVDSTADSEPVAAPRPDLLGTLRLQLGPSIGSSSPKDDYAKFLEEMGDVLGSKP
ncbi:hypothetical protein PHLGIDRAFT_28623 [Phlebiopsis gigantea 11061_1 CR5-6]|uniref:Wbp11/ELF5/Saf1 N-terminal domain-containing protein n=1 Tax=Phlebiopsis gigantea (strain 11061_1 CR5-6) TaxID=745531 RepID=A0A0C3NXC1_PHLG1|nr:hypothetical protein PHLGIDRAFT_28623 [Phlebiopsis gigantea 11061_1 CR5-6]